MNSSISATIIICHVMNSHISFNQYHVSSVVNNVPHHQNFIWLGYLTVADKARKEKQRSWSFCTF